MPLRFKIPGYAGNALLLLLSIVMIAHGDFAVGAVLGALAILNLYLVYKLDQFSREEIWLEHELHMAKLKEELIAERQRVNDLEARFGPASHSPPGA